MHSKLQQFSLFLTLFLLLPCFNNRSLSAQALKIPYLISIEGDIEMVSFFKNPYGDTLVAGNYKGIWKDNNKVWSSEGENDIFLGKWKEGLFNLTLSFGGSRNDMLFDAKCLANGDIILAGSFTERMQLGQRILTTGENSKAVFLTKINEKGEVLWVALFQGSSWKDWGDMQLDEAKDELILCGNFHDKIVFDDGQTFLGIGESSVFAGILNLSSGKVKKMRAFSGSISSNQLYAISLHVRGNSIFITGNFDRDIMVDSLTEIALTRDWDIFLVHLRRDELGSERLLKVGGVYEQRVLTSFMDDKNGDIYLTGALAGVMKIGENTILQSQDGLSDIFILKTNFLGDLKWASLLGGENVQAPLAIYKSDENVWLSGYSLGKLKWQGDPMEPLMSFHSFISKWSINQGKPQTIYTFSGEGNAFPIQFNQFNQQSLLFSGVYRGKVDVKNINLPFSAKYSGFLGYFPLTVTTVKEKMELPFFNLFPNPGDGHFSINGFPENGEVSIWFGGINVHKSPIYKGENFISLPFHLPGGFYLIVVRLDNGATQTRLYLKK